MVIRFDTTCPDCGKEDSVFGHDRFCHDCSLKKFMKSQIKAVEKDKKFRKEVREMEPEIREKLHDKLLKEILEELK